MKPTLFFLLAVFAFIKPAFSQTSVSGGVYSNTNWTKANSPYLVSGNLVVFDQVTLTVEPGVTVIFDSLSRIELRGNLVAKGTAKDTITFTGSKAQKGWWNGVYATYSSAAKGSQITIDHCHFSYANVLFGLDYAYRGPYSFTNSTFYRNNNFNDDDPVAMTIIKNCLFLENNYGPYGGGEDGKMYISDSWFVNNLQGLNGGIVDKCVFTGNTKMGAYMYQSITNSYFYNNKTAIKADHHHDTKIMYNEIYNNEVGVEIDRLWQEPGIDFKYNKICSNTQWNILYNYNNSYDISDNCWCTSDSAAIRAKIRDGYVNTAYGLLNFNRWDSCATTEPFALNVPLTNNRRNIVLNTFPNPTKDVLNIALGTQPAGGAYLFVYNLAGVTIHKMPVTTDKMTVNTTQWAPGVYMLRLVNEQETAITKIVKE